MKKMLLVIREYLNCEENLVMTTDDFLKYIDTPFINPQKEITDILIDIGRTLENDTQWVNFLMSDDTYISARFCKDRKQLAKFINGKYNDDKLPWSLNKEDSSKDIINTITDIIVEEQPSFHHEKNKSHVLDCTGSDKFHDIDK